MREEHRELLKEALKFIAIVVLPGLVISGILWAITLKAGGIIWIGYLGVITPQYCMTLCVLWIAIAFITVLMAYLLPYLEPYLQEEKKEKSRRRKIVENLIVILCLIVLIAIGLYIVYKIEEQVYSEEQPVDIYGAPCFNIIGLLTAFILGILFVFIIDLGIIFKMDWKKEKGVRDNGKEKKER